MKNRVLQSCFLAFLGLCLWGVASLLVVSELSAETGLTESVTSMEFVWVPEGTYQMGQTESEKEDLIKVMGRDKYEKYCADELPRHTVSVDGFWMGKYEVTNAQYRHYKSGHDSKSYGGNSLDGEQQPVVEVSWEDAVAYAKWLSLKSGRLFRLPTEVEWEYACRAGTTTVCYWSADDQACRYANVGDMTAKREWSNWTVHDCEDGFTVTAPVGSLLPNNFGLYDMVGNVWEWCSDWFGKNYYNESPEWNPQGAKSGTCRVARGSCWDNPPRYARSASRNRRRPGNSGYSLGFRLVAVKSAP